MIIEVTYSSSNFIIDSSFVQAIQITADIENILLEGKLVLFDATGSLSSHIKMGELITIRAIRSTNNQVLREYRMRVVDYKKRSSEEDATIVDGLEMHLISDWYYSQTTSTSSYKAGTAAIVSEVLKADPFFEKKRKYIENSTDESAVRYRIDKTNSDFIKMITPYSISENSPMYSYMDHEENFYLKSWRSMENSKVPFVLTPLKADEGLEISSSKGVTSLPVYSYVFSTKGMDTSAIRSYTFNTEHVIYNSPKEILIDSIENTTDLVDNKSPNKGSGSYGWWISPHDAIGMSLHDSNKRDFKMFQIAVLVDTVIARDIPIGSCIMFQLPLLSGHHKESGDYVVKRIEEIWTADGTYSKILLNKV